MTLNDWLWFLLLTFIVACAVFVIALAYTASVILVVKCAIVCLTHVFVLRATAALLEGLLLVFFSLLKGEIDRLLGWLRELRQRDWLGELIVLSELFRLDR